MPTPIPLPQTILSESKPIWISARWSKRVALGIPSQSRPDAHRHPPKS
jgi:hypothetical protein